MDRLKALESLLLRMFTADDLRRLVRHLPDGDTLSGTLPGPNASPVAVAQAVVDELERDGSLDAPALWDYMAQTRPRRLAEIQQVRALFTRETAPAIAPVAAPTSAPTVLTIVLASASPSGAQRVRVDTEFRRIIERLRGSRFRDRLRVVQITAMRFEDLRTALMEHEPHILHLSCHGEADGSLKFESAVEDGAQIVPKKNLLRLLRALGKNLRLVVFNACHSAAVACDVPPTIGLSIGMNDDIRDSESVEFAVAFYETLAFGKSVETAFEVALAGLQVDDEVPRLYPAARDEDSDRLRQQRLVVESP